MCNADTPSRPRLGFFGGTFDPLHLGHLKIAELAVQKIHLEKLLLCPAYHAPLRTEPPLFSASDRFAMVKAICEGSAHLEACTIEIEYRKLRYTLQTIQELSEQYPNYDLFVVIGADQFTKLSEWKGIEKLIRLVHFLVFARGTLQVPKSPLSGVRMTYMENPLIDLSSTKIRNTLRSGALPLDKLPDAVCSYLTEHNLFPLPNNYS
jgi:nicotinate-nucleotide adenylyltransferase